MDDSDWVDSTIPFGSGTVNTQIVSSTGVVGSSLQEVKKVIELRKIRLINFTEYLFINIPQILFQQNI